MNFKKIYLLPLALFVVISCSQEQNDASKNEVSSTVQSNSAQVSFDCEGFRPGREERGDGNSKFEIDIDLEKETGSFCNITQGRCRDYSAIQLNPKFLKGYVYNSALNETFESLYIDRKTLSATIGAIWEGSCEVVDRSADQKF